MLYGIIWYRQLKDCLIIYFEGGFLLIYINTQAVYAESYVLCYLQSNIFRGCDMALICVKNRLLRVICSLYAALILYLFDLISVLCVHL